VEVVAENTIPFSMTASALPLFIITAESTAELTVTLSAPIFRSVISDEANGVVNDPVMLE
jgi:hypothetical protein